MEFFVADQTFMALWFQIFIFVHEKTYHCILSLFVLNFMSKFCFQIMFCQTLRDARISCCKIILFSVIITIVTIFGVNNQARGTLGTFYKKCFSFYLQMQQPPPTSSRPNNISKSIQRPSAQFL